MSEPVLEYVNIFSSLQTNFLVLILLEQSFLTVFECPGLVVDILPGSPLIPESPMIHLPSGILFIKALGSPILSVFVLPLKRTIPPWKWTINPNNWNTPNSTHISYPTPALWDLWFYYFGPGSWRCSLMVKWTPSIVIKYVISPSKSSRLNSMFISLSKAIFLHHFLPSTFYSIFMAAPLSYHLWQSRVSSQNI